jgi:CheY-like chemotaxis protein
MLGNVLLIDDDAFCNKMNSFVLEQHRAAKKIVTYETATEALDYLNKLIEEKSYTDFPDVILLDLNMTYLDGWGFLKKFGLLPLRYKRKASVYILTSSIQSSDREAAAVHADISGYIEKPFTAQELNYVFSSQQARILC